MLSSFSGVSAKERIRLREVAKYYCATSLITPDGPTDFGTSSEAGGPSQKDVDREAPGLSPDKTLTALVQLAACRLRCQRVIASLIDDRVQYLIAEATQSISAFKVNEHDSGDGLLFGVQSIPVESSLCAQVLGAFTGASAFVLSGPGEVNSGHVFIPDVSTEMSTCSLPALRVEPAAVRWYLSVPLKSAAGHVIGAVSAMDSSVHVLGVKDVTVLQEMAALVMQHLEHVRLMDDQRRAEHLLQGVSHFIRGKSSTFDWSSNAGKSGSMHNAHMTTENDLISSIPATDTVRTPLHTASISHASVQRTTLVDTAGSFASSAEVGKPIEPTDALADHADASDTRSMSSSNIPKVVQGAQPASLSSVSTSVQQAFSRAANLIRESMDLDVACFLEMPHNERFRHARKLVTQIGSDTRSEHDHQSFSADDSSPETSSDALRERHAIKRENTFCHRLGFSSRSESSLTDSTKKSSYLNIPSALLHVLTSRYSKGHIFHPGLSGSTSSSDDGQHSTTPSHTSTLARPKLASQIYTLFPAARSLIFLPLYDNDRQQVYAGFLGWTTDPTRSLQKREILYVAGFTHSVMCEVMRLEALAMNKTKSHFISSISHELRSPLHGILAAGQLLSESEILPHQTEFLNMVDTSARTLLDIMNHLLDHSKINRFSKSTTTDNKRDWSARGVEDQSLIVAVDIASLVEETSTSMTGGYQVSRIRGNFEIPDNPSTVSASKRGDDGQVQRPLVILNIESCPNWTFLTERGSWRRIVMNLLGNSLKYTHRGHIILSMSRRRHTSVKQKWLVELKITDTGQGISEEYLKHRLYTPFAQEDNLSVGTGLGLSLVQQIVVSLGGKIDVRSKVGAGTEITVEVPLEQVSQVAQEASIHSGVIATAKDLLIGRLVQLTGIETESRYMGHPKKAPGIEAEALGALNASLSEILRSWLGMSVVGAGAEIHIVEESFLSSEINVFDRAGYKIVILSFEDKKEAENKLRRAISVYLTPPIGPSTLSRALIRLLTETDRPERNRPAKPTPEEIHKSRKGSAASDVNTLSTEGSENMSVGITTPPILAIRPAKLPPQPVSGTQGFSEAILLVDDNDINLRILAITIKRLKLEARGITCISASNGQEALNKYIQATESSLNISTIFMDLSMPIMDGFQSTRAIRAYERDQHMTHHLRSTIIALTGLASAEARAEAETCEFDVFLTKPVSPKTIREMLQHRKISILPEGDGPATPQSE